MTSVRFGLAIDQATNDLFLTGSGDLATVSDAEAVGQHVRQRLSTFTGEWFLDTTAGVPWLDRILGKAYDPALAESVVKAEILNTDGVTEITSFSVTFDKATRGLIIRSVEVGTMFDEEVSV
ncbi:hypothetical protein [Rhizobium bangladeshense]|uniref:hypothetical protein n=1 Tax=Rhizobium bangladeshense TaxID=1138189 RepID=UPI001C832C2B|nr:hypothetical protein [Rhizobium bangladeshense]MBX4889763.1 hypothetical protein [Rhizobium bangladeshense]